MSINVAYQKEAKVQVQKWNNEHLLEGLIEYTNHSPVADQLTKSTAVILENQYLYQANQNMPSNTGTDDSAMFKKIMLPMVRRFYPSLIAHHTVGVQPMLGPQALVYYIRFQAGVTKGTQKGTGTPYTGSDNYWVYNRGNGKVYDSFGNLQEDASRMPNPAVSDPTVDGDWDETTLQQKLSGEVVIPINYSSQKVEKESGLLGTTTSEKYQILYSPMLIGSIIPSNAEIAENDRALDKKTAYSAFGSVAGTTALSNLAAWTTIPAVDGTNYENYKYEFVQYFYLALGSTNCVLTNAKVRVTADVKSGATAGTLPIDKVYESSTLHAVVSAITYDVSSYEFTFTKAETTGAKPTLTITYEYNMEANRNLPVLKMSIEYEDVKARTRKLRYTYSTEASQDIRAQHNIDVDSELSEVATKQIALELDRELLVDVRDNAGTNGYWDWGTIGHDGTQRYIEPGASFVFGQSPFIPLREKYNTLYFEMIRVSNLIRKKTLRNEANWMVMSPEMYAVIESAGATTFAAAEATGFESSLGVNYAGKAGKYKIFVDPSIPSEKILMGYKGEAFGDVGYYYCPYIPLTVTDQIIDPMSGAVNKIFMTRYGKKLLATGPRYYATITVKNFV